MPIISLQRRQVEVGRIRIGETKPTSNGRGRRPAKLDRFKFTTESRALADHVQNHFGGTVQEWTPQGGGPKQWECLSDARSLNVIVPPNSVSQWFEMWSGGGCVRRCDGERNVLVDKPCQCPLDPADRARMAADGEACKPTTRINVMLADVPGIGVWRLETHGFYAATELPAVAELLAASGGYIPGRLELQERSAKRPKAGGGMETRKWMVPVLHVDAAPAEMLAGRGPQLGVTGRETPAIKPAGDLPALPAGQPTDTAAQHPVAGGSRDEYQTRGKNATSVEAVRQAWAEASAAGVLDDDLRAYLGRRAHEIENGKPDADDAPADEPPVEAEADEPDVDKAWQALFDLAGERGWTSSQLENLVIGRFGKSSDECNGWQFVELADAIRAGEVTP